MTTERRQTRHLWAESPTFTLSTEPFHGRTGFATHDATKPENLDEVLTSEEVAVFLKVPEATLADWRYMQKGPPFHKVGRHVRYLSHEVRAWLACQ